MTDCVVCARPNRVDTAQVCHPCVRRLQASLERAADLAGELETTIARQGRSGDRGGRVAGAEPPLPVDLGAADSAWAVNNTITTWARHVAEERGLTVTGTDPDPTVLAARWLTGQLDWLRHRPEAAEAWDELADACRLLERAVDRAVPRWYAGPCGCGAELYAAAGADRVHCRTCEVTHDASARKAWLLESARGTLARASLISAALGILGEPVPVGTVWSWASRGRIVARGRDTDGSPMYLVGEVLDLRVEWERSAKAKVARRGDAPAKGVRLDAA